METPSPKRARSSQKVQPKCPVLTRSVFAVYIDGVGGLLSCSIKVELVIDVQTVHDFYAIVRRVERPAERPRLPPQFHHSPRHLRS